MTPYPIDLMECVNLVYHLCLYLIYYRSGGQIGDLKLVFLDQFQTIFHNFHDMQSIILFITLS